MSGAARRELPREVRIIGGSWKRSKLSVADAAGLRPTPDRVRETLFNWLGQTLAGWRCVDAFAGSGALGFEAASRGAGEVVLVERDRRLVGRLEEAKARLKADAVRIVNTDAITFMARSAPGAYDLVFIDPPFDSDLAAPALAAAARLVVPGGFVYLEAARPYEGIDGEPNGFELFRQARAGAVHFHLLRRTAF